MFLDTKKEVQASKESQAEVLSVAMDDESNPFAEFGSEVQLSSEDLPF
jgi:hypothetical protein